ncbi:hypothetical protein KUTeg_002978 [Tegillarca granosa]|uniref:Ragulator complex protein LAMTOR3 n=1 Tax=Tegillarca granosa TaxID=220873 RepID=A0ABQ9FKR9_TEGGR|nr:hypothetical protein KUTeg_002978 [Tegillarca granosa]
MFYGRYIILFYSVDGLLAIVITDRDGVPLLKVSTDQAPELALRHNFLCTFGTAAEQASKIGLKQTRKFICMYQNYQIDKSPLVLTFIATVKTNTGLLLNLESDMKDIFKDLSTVITNS